MNIFLYVIYLGMYFNVEFLFDAGADLGSEVDDIFRRCIIGIDDDKRLFRPYLRATEFLAFPFALLDEPCCRN